MTDKQQEKYKRIRQKEQIIDIISELEEITKRLQNLGPKIDELTKKVYVSRFILNLAILFDDSKQGVQFNKAIGIVRFDQFKKDYDLDKLTWFRDTVIAHLDIAVFYDKDYSKKRTQTAHEIYSFLLQEPKKNLLLTELIEIKEKLQQDG